MSRLDAWVDKHGWQLLGLLVAGVVAVTAAKAQLDAKAEKSAVEEIRRDVRDVKDLVCQLPQYAGLRSCQRS